MSTIEVGSWMSKIGYNDRELLEDIDKHYDEIECELNGNKYKEPRKCDHNFCMGSKLRKIVDYQKSTLVCMKCRLCEYYPVYVTSYNHTMQPSRRKCFCKRSDNFKVILSQFFMVESSLFHMTLSKRLGMKYTMKLTYCTTTPYQ